MLQADYYGDVRGSLDSNANAIAALKRSETSPHQRLMYVEAQFNLATLLRAKGDQGKSLEYIDEAVASLQRGAIRAPSLETRVMTAAWKLRNDLLATSGARAPWAARLAGLADALQRTRQGGLLLRSVEVLIILLEYYAFAGLDDEALNAGRNALLLAKRAPSDATAQRVGLEVATRLLATKYWRYGAAVLPPSAPQSSPDSYTRHLYNHTSALTALRFGDFQKASALAIGDDNWGHWVTLSIRRRSIAALSAHYSDRSRSALNLIQEAIGQAEPLGSASVLQDVYRSASIIIGDAKSKNRLAEVTRFLQS
jgi:hypothetical protein